MKHMYSDGSILTATILGFESRLGNYSIDLHKIAIMNKYLN